MCNLTKGYLHGSPNRLLKCIWCDREEDHPDGDWPRSWPIPTLDMEAVEKLTEMGPHSATYQRYFKP